MDASWILHEAFMEINIKKHRKIKGFWEVEPAPSGTSGLARKFVAGTGSFGDSKALGLTEEFNVDGVSGRVGANCETSVSYL